MNRPSRPVLAIATAAFLWSTSFALTKNVLSDVGPIALGAIRFSAAALLLAALTLASRGFTRVPRRTRYRHAGAGLLGITAYFVLENYGVQNAAASDATLIVAAYPVLTTVLESSLGRGRASMINVLGMTIAFAGVALVVSADPGVGDRAANRPLGLILLAVGGIAWALYSILSKTTGSGSESSLTVSCQQNAAGAIGFLLLVPLVPESAPQVNNGSVVFTLVYLAIGCSAAAFLLYTYGLQYVTATQAVGILNLVPVFGVFSAVLIADEPWTWQKVVGGCVVVLGVFLTTRSGHPREARGSSNTPERLVSAPLRP